MGYLEFFSGFVFKNYVLPTAPEAMTLTSPITLGILVYSALVKCGVHPSKKETKKKLASRRKEKFTNCDTDDGFIEVVNEVDEIVICFAGMGY